jgi:phosphopantetheinyl transferase (holo-ACP synthase)
MMSRALGEEYPGTLSRASNLAVSLSDQGTCAVAEAIKREVLAVSGRGASRVTSASNLALSLLHQGKYAVAEAMSS